MPLQQRGVLSIHPGGLVRCRQQDLAGIGRANREQSLKEPLAFALWRRGIGTRRVM